MYPKLSPNNGYRWCPLGKLSHLGLEQLCTTFFDNISDYVYVHFMIDLSISETLLAMVEMEKIMKQAGRTIKHYHPDNGIFSDNGFVDAINERYQKLIFWGVLTHHQNSIIEKKNKKFTIGARMLPLNGTRMWPQIIDEIFWPFSIKAVSKSLNSLQIDFKVRTPESILHGVYVEDIPVKYYQTLFC